MNVANKQRTEFSRSQIAIGYLVLAVVAFVLPWLTGHRGVFFLDQAGIFDGAYRITLGQVPYKDIFFPFSPLTFWYQALIFRLFGVSFSSMVLAAALLNVLATLIVFDIVRRVFRAGPLPSTVAGLLTALYFQTPFGTLYYEQLSFGLGLAALWLVLQLPAKGGRAPILLSFAAGVCLMAGVLAKQNSGAVMVPVVAALIVSQQLPHWRKAVLPLLAIAAGMTVVATLFLLWIWTASDPASFQRFTIEVAKEIAASRVADPVQVFQKLTFAMNSTGARLANMFSFFSALLLVPALIRTLSVNDDGARVLRAEIWLALCLPVGQNVFQIVTEQDPVAGTPFTGLILACAAAAWMKVLSGTNNSAEFSFPVPLSQHWIRTVTVAVTALAVILGGTAIWRRTVHGFGPGTRFDTRLQIPRASRLQWGDPTRMGSELLTARQFEEVWRTLTTLDKTFFVFGDATMLYGLVGKHPPQPLLYFDIGHSIRASDLPDIQRRIISDLERNNTGVIVTETSHFLKNETEYEAFTELNGWIRDRFVQTHAVGPFRIWERRTGAHQSNPESDRMLAHP